MLQALRQWWIARRLPPAWASVRSWARAQGAHFKVSHDGQGFIIESARSDWRAEWGPSSRMYLGSHEFRIRAELPLDPEAVAVVMPKPLLEALERELYASFTDSVQTRVDEHLPTEVRWLALAERLGPSSLGDGRDHLGAVATDRAWLKAWLAGPVGRLLLDLTGEPAAGASAWSLSVGQGQMVLRLGGAQVAAEELARWVHCFEWARDEALRLPASSPEDWARTR